MLLKFILTTLLFLPATVLAESNYSIYLLGDAGDANQTALNFLKTVLLDEQAEQHIIFLGDNVYPKGIRDESDSNHIQDLQKLNKQLRVVKASGTRATFVPGNHDWGEYTKPKRFTRNQLHILRQEQIVTGFLKDKFSFLPASSCPGPALVRNKHSIIMAIDTQWLLFDTKNKKSPLAECPTNNSAFFDAFTKTVSNINGDNTILVSHHPLASDGQHGSETGFRCTQGLNCKRYLSVRQKLRKALRNNPALVCAAGHDHSLQVLEGDASCRYYVVSGAMSNVTPVKRSSRQYYADSTLGFIRLEFKADSPPLINVFTVEGGPESPVFTKALSRTFK